MNDVLNQTTVELCSFLSGKLSELNEDWWERNVINRLSFQQQRIAEQRGFKTVEDLDLAALLRVLDQNWHDISYSADLPHEGRSWLKELQTVRNKWSHRSSSELQAVPASEVYRDADTLGLLLGMIKASQHAIDAVEKENSANS